VISVISSLNTVTVEVGFPGSSKNSVLHPDSYTERSWFILQEESVEVSLSSKTSDLLWPHKTPVQWVLRARS
jgi:hypothetical protein